MNIKSVYSEEDKEEKPLYLKLREDCDCLKQLLFQGTSGASYDHGYPWLRSGRRGHLVASAPPTTVYKLAD